MNSILREWRGQLIENTYRRKKEKDGLLKNNKKRDSL